MVYTLLFLEFARIGLFAIGGGMVTLPFLFGLSEHYSWFTADQLVDMVAVAESTPGPLGINMATFAGFKAAGFLGSLVATFSLILPSLVIVGLLARFFNRYRGSGFFMNIMYTMRPAAIGLITYAGIELGKIALLDAKSLSLCAGFWMMIRLVKIHPIMYIIFGGILGIYFGL